MALVASDKSLATSVGLGSPSPHVTFSIPSPSPLREVKPRYLVGEEELQPHLSRTPKARGGIQSGSVDAHNASITGESQSIETP